MIVLRDEVILSFISPVCPVHSSMEYQVSQKILSIKPVLAQSYQMDRFPETMDQDNRG